jgi:hypothetical protein
VTLDPTGLVTGLAVEGCRLVGLPASRLELRRPRAAPAPPLSVDHLPTAELRARTDGGLELNLLPPNGLPRAALTVDGAAVNLALVPQGGNVGIGTTSPGAKLVVNDATAAELRVDSNSGAFSLTIGVDSNHPWIGSRTNHDLRILTNSTEKLRVLADGKVGIGTATPQGKLEVSGDIRAGNSDLYFTKTDHNHTGIGNTPGFAAIENAANYGALMILGRAGTARGRYVRLWDYLQINGGMDVTGYVGIGTTEPRTPLHVLGRIATGRDFTSAGAMTFYPPDGFAWFHIDNGPAGGRPLGRLRFSHGVNPGDHEIMSIDQNSNVYIYGRLIAPQKQGYVIDQFVNKLGEALEQGDVVVIGENQSSLYYGPNNNIPIPEIDIAQRAYDTRVCGIVDEVHAFLQAEQAAKTAAESDRPAAMQSRDFTPEELGKLERTKVEPGQLGGMVTLGAFALCKVDADIAPVVIGDLLTTSPTKGHAQKVLDPDKAVGAILGKALGSLEKGKGKIPVLVMLQ